MPARALKDEPALLAIVRHGEAQPEEVDPDRPLTPQGAEDVGRIAAWLAAAEVPFLRILHSGKRRAEQTAEILQRRLQASEGATASDGLRPKDDVGLVVDLAERTSQPWLIVGHLPHLERVIDSLLSGRIDTRLVELEAGGAALLARRPEGWVLRALMQPSLIPMSRNAP